MGAGEGHDVGKRGAPELVDKDVGGREENDAGKGGIGVRVDDGGGAGRRQ